MEIERVFGDSLINRCEWEKGGKKGGRWMEIFNLSGPNKARSVQDRPNSGPKV